MPTRLLSTPVDPFTTTTLKDASTPIDPRLGALLASIAGLHRLNSVLSEVRAELAALRASKWTAPTFEVVYNLRDKCVHGLVSVWCATCEDQRKAGVVEKHSFANRDYIEGLKKPESGVDTARVFTTQEINRFADDLWLRLNHSERLIKYDWRNLISQRKECQQASQEEPACLRRVEPRFNEVTPADVDWAMRQQAFPHSEGMPRAAKNWDADRRIYVQENWEPRPVKNEVVDYVKLAKDYFLKNVNELKEVSKFQRHAKMVWNYCLTFEFPKVCNNEAMGEAAKILINDVPREDLMVLIESMAERGLLEGSFIVPEVFPVTPVKQARGCSRHYVLGKRRSEALTIVRKEQTCQQHSFRHQ